MGFWIGCHPFHVGVEVGSDVLEIGIEDIVFQEKWRIGLDLVRTDTTIHAVRIAKLQREFHNLTFAACQNTIERLQREQNIAIRLLPGVIIIDSGMAEIMRRQNQGWTYLQV